MRPGLGEVRINQSSHKIIIRGTVKDESLADFAVHLLVFILSCQSSVEQSGRCPLFKFVFLAVEHLFKPPSAHEVPIVMISVFLLIILCLTVVDYILVCNVLLSTSCPRLFSCPYSV